MAVRKGGGKYSRICKPPTRHDNQSFCLIIKQLNTIPNTLIDWYTAHRRDLPWRKTKDPYAILLSEIILQQTRVDQGLDYYHRFLETFPEVSDLASASEQEVLNLWQGLGYYSRARNLHKAAKRIVELNSFPDTSSELLKLPGVGPYTSAAIASFAFDEVIPVLDGNVFRFIARLLCIEADPSNEQAKKVIRTFLGSIIPKEDAASFNQALMEFGSLQCKPQKPNCETCPLNSECIAFKQSKVSSIPLKKEKPKRRKRYFNYLVVLENGKILVQQRGGADIWENMFEFPLIESLEALDIEDLAPLIPNDILKNASVGRYFRRKKHLLSHQEIYSTFLVLNLDKEVSIEGKKWIPFAELEDHPFPRIIDKFLEENSLLEGKNPRFV